MPVSLVPVDGSRPVLVDKAILLLGRHPDCDVVLTQSRKVSRKHCCIAQVNKKYVVRDLGSMNGVRVNGHPVENLSELHIGDELAVGDVVYLVQEQIASRASKAAPPSLGNPQNPEMPKSVQQNAPPPPLSSELSKDVPIPVSDDSESFVAEPPLLQHSDSNPDIPLAPDSKDDEEHDPPHNSSSNGNNHSNNGNG